MSTLLARLATLSPERRRLLMLQQSQGASAPVDGPRAGPRPGRLPLSHAQQRLWMLDQMHPGSAAYNVPAVLRISGPLDAAVLRRALAEVVRRHEALRTVFRDGDEGPEQVIRPAGELSLPLEDLRALDPAAREARMMELAMLPFRLREGPLLRATLVRAGEDEHELLLVMHHAVSDGWSLGVLVRELSALYDAFLAGGASPLAEPPLQYADYALWQREQLRGPGLDAPLGYWRGVLAGAPAVLDLPTDRVRPAAPSGRGATHRFSLGAELSEGVREVARAHAATPFMVLLAGVSVLLSRYAGRDDLVVGTPVANRTRAEVEGLIGFFANTLALRMDLAGAASFGELLGRVRERTLGAFAHQEVPFERVVEELRVERHAGRTPLFQVMFVLQNAPVGPARLGPARMELREGEGRTAKFDLTFAFAEDGGRAFAGVLEYATELWDRASAAAMAEQLRALLGAAVADPSLAVAALPLMDAATRRTVVEAWNRTAAPYPRDAAVHALFEAVARERPHAPALESGGEAVSYGELNRAANRLARRLRARGAGPERRVAVCLERGPELVTVLLAVLKTGAAYVPLDPTHPAERLRWMVRDCAAAAVVTDAARLAVLGVAADDAVLVDDPATRAALAAEDAAELGVPGHPLAAAYVTYTSGSTGRPKGIAVPHRGICRLVLGTDYVRLGAGDRMAQLSNATFDVAAFEVWGALLNGGVLVWIPRESALDPEELPRALAAARIQVMFLTTALFHQVARAAPGALAGVRDVLVGGEAIQPRPAHAVLRTGGPARLLNGYGPTENTTYSTWHLIASLPADAATVPIGRPLANSTAYVLDAAMRPLPPGVPGELYLGGDGLARGYLGRPALTAERFVPHPFAAGGERLYRTGDRARWNARGEIEFLGRVDHQVQIRGFRVEPGEVEAALLAHPGVREAIVVAGPDPAGELRLVGYAAGPACPEADALREHLRTRVPDYMVPAALVVLPTLPLNAVGKVDRGALPVPAAAASAAYEPPATPAEAALAEIWRELLGAERIGAGDHFFALGGHSLLATQAVTRIRAVLGVALPLREVFEHPTPRALARRVEALRGTALAAAPLGPAERAADAPLSPAQERMWVLQRMNPGGTEYHMPFRLRLRGALHADALRRALDEVVRRHEALRTALPVVDGGPVQRVLPPAPLALDRRDLRPLAADARAAEADRAAAEHGARPFDLERGPLVRAALLRTGDEEHELLLALHHAVADGWSMGVLFRELSVLYDAFAAGRPSPLPEPPVQYADYAVWQRAQLENGALDAQRAYWKGVLDGAPAVLELPADRPRPPVPSHRGAAHRFALGAELSGAVRALARGEEATPFMVLLAGFALLLSRCAGRDDLVVGTPIAGRTRAETEGMIGFFANTLALRLDLSGGPGFGALVRRVRDRTLGAYAHQDLPFDRVVEELGVARQAGRTPLFQVMFVMQNAPLALPRLGAVQVEPRPDEGVTAKFDLTLAFGEEDGGLTGVLEYATDLWERGSAERLAEQLRALLAAAVADPAARADALPMMDAAARRAVVEGGSRTAAPYPRESTVHAVFSAVAAERPGAVALACGDERVTYGELEARANRLARRLARLGVGPESRVGVCVERGPELAVALLAVLKAGGAYVPLDPSYPAERLAWMLEDCAVRVLVAHARLADALPARGAAVVRVDADAAEIAAQADTPPERSVGPDGLAYVLYSSGSTGRPRGVAVPHRAVLRLVRGADYTELGPEQTFLQLAPVSFDASTLEVWGPLLNGGVLALLPPGPPSLAEIGEAVRRHGVTTLWLTAGLFHALVDARIGALAGVRQLLAGGDVLSLSHVRRVLAEHAGVRLVNGYGPTENTTFTACRTVTAADTERASIPIGRPVANTTAYVLDGAGDPCAPGVPGELFTGGDGVARGYLDRPGATAAAFVPDPFSPVPGARMYRTGDRVRWLADGALEFLGRMDRQVKIRGFRIEPGEVEAALGGHPGVGACAVAAREDGGERRLVAYVTGRGGAAPDAAALREHLRARLPGHMVPEAFVALERLPLTPNGKTDRAALPAPGAPAAAAEYVAPEAGVQAEIAAVWREVLGVERVGARDSFFEIGGNSLLLARVHAALGARLRRAPAMVDLFRCPTVASLAAFLERAEPAPEAGAAALEREQARIDRANDRLRRLRGAGRTEETA